MMRSVRQQAVQHQRHGHQHHKHPQHQQQGKDQQMLLRLLLIRQPTPLLQQCQRTQPRQFLQLHVTPLFGTEVNNFLKVYLFIYLFHKFEYLNIFFSLPPPPPHLHKWVISAAHKALFRFMFSLY